MRLYALVNNNVVTSVQSLEDSDVAKAVSENAQVIDVEDMHPIPEVGWTLVGNKLQPFGELSLEELEEALARKKITSGRLFARDSIARVGARNKILAKTSQQITQLLTALSGVRALLETGALGTARDIVTQLKAGYPEYADIFDRLISEINDFESKYGL